MFLGLLVDVVSFELYALFRGLGFEGTIFAGAESSEKKFPEEFILYNLYCIGHSTDNPDPRGTLCRCFIAAWYVFSISS